MKPKTFELSSKRLCVSLFVSFFMWGTIRKSMPWYKGKRSENTHYCQHYYFSLLCYLHRMQKKKSLWPSKVWISINDKNTSIWGSRSYGIISSFCSVNIKHKNPPNFLLPFSQATDFFSWVNSKGRRCWNLAQPRFYLRSSINFWGLA